MTVADGRTAVPLKELLKVGRERKEESMKYYGQEKALNG